MINLRDYQRESIDALYAWFGQHEKGNPLLVLPTGAGKSVIAAALVQEIIEKWPSQRILIVTHVKELIEQNYLKLMELWPQAPAGVNSASLKRRDADSQIIFAGIQSIYNRPYELGWFDLILVDEAHLIPVKTMTGMYRTFLDQMENINPAIRIVGLTATPYRLDDGLLTEGKNKLFHDIAYEIPINLLLDRGYLCPLTTQPTSTRANLSSVKKQGGDFVISQLAQAVDQAEITKAAIAEVVELASDRKSWLIFCVTVAHAENVRDEIRGYGIPCEMVTGETPKTERHDILTRFKRGSIQALVNVSVLTTGFDAPCIDLMVYLRPTQSLSLYVQMAGRGMRLKEGKESCIASGQRVLTNQGLIPIERVTKEMKVWDGVEYVPHAGVIYKGKQEVITYAGLTATADHKVWTKKGWRSFGECANQQTPISVTGNGRTNIQQSDHYFRSSFSDGEKQSLLFKNLLQWLWQGVIEGVHKFNEKSRRMSRLWKKRQLRQACFRCTEMVDTAMRCCQTTMYQSKRQTLQRLWGAWNTVFLQISFRNGFVFDENGSTELNQKPSDRQNRQQWSLRIWESQSGSTSSERQQSKNQLWDKAKSFIQGNLPRSKICRCNAGEINQSGNDFRGNQGSVFQPSFNKAEREVWDILNAGPRHRFTCEGLLVSNCLVLDFAGNIARHGPIDAINPPKKMEAGESTAAPTKECPSCGSIMHAAAKECADCGYIFPSNPKHEDKASTLAILTAESPIELEQVSEVIYSRHQKEGKPDSLRVDYYAGFRRAHSEWVCIEHAGLAGSEARAWVAKRLTPEIVIEELSEYPIRKLDTLLDIAHLLQRPTALKLKQSGKFKKVIDYIF